MVAVRSRAAWLVAVLFLVSLNAAQFSEHAKQGEYLLYRQAAQESYPLPGTLSNGVAPACWTGVLTVIALACVSRGRRWTTGAFILRSVGAVAVEGLLLDLASWTILVRNKAYGPLVSVGGATYSYFSLMIALWESAGASLLLFCAVGLLVRRTGSAKSSLDVVQE